MGCRRTKRLMLSVLHGKWLLSHAWLQACLDAGCPVPEESFEVCILSSSCCCCVTQLCVLLAVAQCLCAGCTGAQAAHALLAAQVQKDAHGPVGALLGRMNAQEGQKLLPGWEMRLLSCKQLWPWQLPRGVP